MFWHRIYIGINKNNKVATNKQKVAIIGTVGLPACYGGFETLTDHLVKNMSDTYDMTVYCSGSKYRKEERMETYHGAKLVYLPLQANGIQSILYDTLSILHALFFADVLLILGVAGAWILPFVRLFTGKRIIISIDGIEWKRGKWSRPAKLYLWWAEKLAVKYSHIDISDNESIQDYTAQRYGSLSRIIEYGADHAQPAAMSSALREQYPFLRNPYAFKVCRIEPENNIHVVLEAFSQLTKHQLVIIGNWKNSDYGIRLRDEFSMFSNIHMLDPIYDQQKLDMIRSNAVVYVHGHSAGGTNPSLVEAMYLGLPVIAYNVSYNRTTTEGKALYFSGHTDLYELIRTTEYPELTRIGKVMKEVAHRRYTWSLIAAKYRLLVDEALSTSRKSDVTPAVTKVDKVLSDLQIQHLKHQKMFFEK